MTSRLEHKGTVRNSPPNTGTAKKKTKKKKKGASEREAPPPRPYHAPPPRARLLLLTHAPLLYSLIINGGKARACACACAHSNVRAMLYSRAMGMRLTWMVVAAFSSFFFSARTAWPLYAAWILVAASSSVSVLPSDAGSVELGSLLMSGFLELLQPMVKGGVCVCLWACVSFGLAGTHTCVLRGCVALAAPVCLTERFPSVRTLGEKRKRKKMLLDCVSVWQPRRELSQTSKGQSVQRRQAIAGTGRMPVPDCLSGWRGGDKVKG